MRFMRSLAVLLPVLLLLFGSSLHPAGGQSDNPSPLPPPTPGDIPPENVWVECTYFTELTSCLSGRVEADNVLGPTTCAWKFAVEEEVSPHEKSDDHHHGNHTVETLDPGECFDVPSCDLVEHLNRFDEMQLDAFVPYQNVSSAFLLSTKHPCVALSSTRFRLLVTCICLLFLTFVFVVWAMATKRPGVMKLLFTFQCGSLMLLVTFSMVFAWNLSVSLLVLLPCFALFVLQQESVHTVPALVGEEHWHVPYRGKLRGMCATVLLGMCLLLLQLVGIVCMMVQFMLDVEIVAVQALSTMDALATTLQIPVMLWCENHHFTHTSKKHLASITALWALCLWTLLALMFTACEQDEWGSTHTTLEEYETCEGSISGRSYALAFFSMSRQIVLTWWDTMSYKPHHETASAHSDRVLESVEEVRGNSISSGWIRVFMPNARPKGDRKYYRSSRHQDGGRMTPDSDGASTPTLGEESMGSYVPPVIHSNAVIHSEARVSPSEY